MKHCNPKENIPLYTISIIALAPPLSGYIFKGLTADVFPIIILFPIVLGVLKWNNLLNICKLTGYLVMVSMYGGENIRHNIVIVGYYPDGTLIYMDPESNSLKEGGENITSGNYVYVITGNKDK